MHRGKLYWLMFLMSVVALGEGLSMTLLLPLMSVLGVAGMSDDGPVQEFVSGVLGVFGVSGSIFGVFILVLMAFSLQALLYITQIWWTADLQRKYGEYWQKRLFEAIITSRWTFIVRSSQGELVNAITQETLRLSGAFMVMAQIASYAVVIVVYLCISFLLSWEISLGLCLLAVMLFLLIKKFTARNYDLGRKISIGNGKLMGLASEYIGGVKVVKACATEQRTIDDIAQVTEELRVNHTWATFFPGLTKAIFELAAIFAFCGVLAAGSLYGLAPGANMLLILGLFVRLLPRFNALQQNLQILNTQLPALEKLEAIYKEATANSERPRGVSNYNVVPTGELTIENLTAGFNNITIIRDITVKFPQTGYYGIVGESGAGKSTLVHALLGLCDIYAGQIAIGGDRMQVVALPTWRRALGFVPQETILFNRSVAENIAWSAGGASEAEIIVAAKKAKAHDFIERLPKGYQTIVGDHGVRLSGGERQRVGIARALISNPDYLILDEATSALDSASENVILETIDALRRDYCIISIAHRLSTIRSADQIFLLDGGYVVERGSWNELLSKKGLFHALVRKQNIQ